MAHLMHRLELAAIKLLPTGRIKHLAERRIEDLRFVVVGGIGFLVNLLALWLFHGRLGISLFLAQLLASELALLSNFTFHHTWTYQNYASANLIRRLGKFHATAWAGALIGSLGVWGSVTFLHIHYLFGVVVGAAVALGWNYFFNKYVIWSKHRPSQEATL